MSEANQEAEGLSAAEQMLGLRSALDRAWAADTAAYPEIWNPERPSSGHCLIAALLVQDVLGGDILKGHLNGTDVHYWNRVHGLTVDLTSDQFDVMVMDEQPTVRDRRDILANDRTIWRYDTLRRRAGLSA